MNINNTHSLNIRLNVCGASMMMMMHENARTYCPHANGREYKIIKNNKTKQKKKKTKKKKKKTEIN